MDYKKLFILYIFFLNIFPIITPTLVEGLGLDDLFWTLSLFGQDSYKYGLIYSFFPSLFLIILLYYFIKNKKYEFKNKSIFSYNILFYVVSLSYLVPIVINIIYGPSQSGLASSRPSYVVYITYLTSIFNKLYYPLLFYSYIKNKKVDLSILIFLYLFFGVVDESRSVPIFFIFNLLLFLSIIPKLILKVNLKAIFISTSLILVIFITDVLRRPEVDNLRLFRGIYRLYENIQVVYFSFEDHKEINRIILENQPYVTFDQMFSFLKSKRTYFPSSMKLGEYWGAELQQDERGHFPGYPYGWLGLSHGIFGWWGILFLIVYFIIILILLKNSLKKINIINLLYFQYLVYIFFEFFWNLGLESYIEKVFKSGIYSIVCILFYLFCEITMKNFRNNINLNKIS